MRKSLLALSLMLTTGAAALTLPIGASAQPASPSPMVESPMMLAQLNVTPERRSGEHARRGTPPSAEQLAQRHAAQCKEGTARMAGHLAYLETRLELTANQRTTFNRWRDVRMSAASQRAQSCTTRMAQRNRDVAQAQARPSPVDRMARQEERLRQRLAAISAERPALEALYNSLSTEQRARFQPEAGPRHAMARGPMRQHNTAPRGPMRTTPPAPSAR